MQKLEKLMKKWKVEAIVAKRRIARKKISLIIKKKQEFRK